MLHAAENLSPFFAESFSAIADAKAHAASIRENDISVIVSAVPDDAQAVVLDARIRERRGKLPTIRMISYRCASVVHLFLLRACVGCRLDGSFVPLWRASEGTRGCNTSAERYGQMQ